MLEAQGFVRTDQIDIFDGRPVVQCETKSISAVNATPPFVVSQASGSPRWRTQPESQLHPRAMVATYQSPFFTIQSGAMILDDFISLDLAAMHSLKVGQGDKVWLMKP